MFDICNKHAELIVACLLDECGVQSLTAAFLGEAAHEPSDFVL